MRPTVAVVMTARSDDDSISSPGFFYFFLLLLFFLNRLERWDPFLSDMLNHLFLRSCSIHGSFILASLSILYDFIDGYCNFVWIC